MAGARKPTLEERCVFTYRSVPRDVSQQTVADDSVEAMLGLGFEPLGRVLATLKEATDATPLVNEVFASPRDATFATVLNDTSVGGDTFTLATVLQNGVVVATVNDMPDWWWKAYGPGMRLGRDDRYDEEYFATGSVNALVERHAARVKAACTARDSWPRPKATMQLYLAMRSARARARANWYAGQMKTGFAVAIGLFSAGALAIISAAIAGMSAADSHALQVAVLVGCLLANGVLALFVRRLLTYSLEHLGPQLHARLRSGRQRAHTDLEAAELEQAVKASGARA